MGRRGARVSALALGLLWPACARRRPVAGAAAARTHAADQRPAAERRRAVDAPTRAAPPERCRRRRRAPRRSLAEALDRPGDVTFRNMTIEAALFTIGETWKVNIVTGKEIEGTVNGVFKQAPLREILDAVLLANGYSYRAVGDSLVVQATGVVGSANPLFQSLTLPIQYSNLDEVVEGAKLLASEGGQVQALPSARSVLVVDYADRVESIAAFVERLEASAAQLAGTASPRGAAEPARSRVLPHALHSRGRRRAAAAVRCSARWAAWRSCRGKIGCWSSTTPPTSRWSARCSTASTGRGRRCASRR